jgi:Phosphodiester glycosidase
MPAGIGAPIQGTASSRVEARQRARSPQAAPGQPGDGAPRNAPAERPAVASQRGRFRGASWAAAWVDPRRCCVDLACYGRRQPGWSATYATVDELPRDAVVALNGTFFSLVHNEPVGILVYDDGRRTFTPHIKKWLGREHRKVASLDRSFLAVLADGSAVVSTSGGRSAEAVRTALERARGCRVRCLVGGGGPLVGAGRSLVIPARLRAAGFDAQSGVRERERCRRTGVGLTRDGRILLLTAGLSGPGVSGAGLTLSDFAALAIEQHAREALFLDCGSSTAMRLDTGWERGGRAVPTWLVVRRRHRAQPSKEPAS